MKWLAAAALSVACFLAAAQPAPAAIEPQGEPQPGEALRDPDFGVISDRFGLDRRVQMYQWSAGEDGYRRVWNSAPIDSSGFPPDRQNPPGIPLESRQWWSQTATLDGLPIDPTVLKTLGRWEEFRPGFSRLPGNLAATFQPEGDGLTSSANPLDPQIGDLRVTWRELVLPSLVAKVELRDGAWRLSPRAAQAPVHEAALSPVIVIDDPREDGDTDETNSWAWWAAGAAALLVLLGWGWRRRRNQHSA